MKRFLNFRPLLFVFVSFMGGIFSLISVILGNIVPIIFCAVIAIISLIFLIIDLCNKNLFKRFANICGTKRLLWPCFCVVIGFVVGVASSAIGFVISNKRPLEDGTYTCSAKVSEVLDKQNTQTVLLKNIVVDETMHNFMFKLTLNTTDIKIGDELTFTAKLFASKLVQNGNINTAILKNNIKYYGYIVEDSLTIKSGSANFIEIIKDKTKDILLDNMSDQNAGFAYATIVGDKSLLSDSYYNVFKNAGLAHILAVSGLHVGFLVSAVLFILKLFKLRKKYKFFIVAFILLLYCTMCGFSPSIFRASVMSLCLMLGMVLGEQNDTLSNLSLAGIIVLFFQPLHLYDVGFLLSFSSVFGILLLSKQISKLLEKIKVPKVLSDMISVTISATLGTLPVVFAYFGEISVISLLSNLIVLPLFSIMFVILLICVIINLILPLPFLLIIAEFVVNVVVNLSGLFAKFSMIKTFAFDTFSGIIYFALLFLISRFFLLKSKNKAIIALCVTLAISPYLCTINMPKRFDNNFVAITSNVQNSLFVATSQNQKVLINVGSDSYDVNSIKNMLKTLKVYSLDYLLLFDYDDSDQSNVVEFAKDFDIKNIIAFGKLESSTKVGLSTSLLSNQNLSFCEDTTFSTQHNQISIEILYINNIFKASNIFIDDLSILKIENNLTANQITSNSKFFVGYKYCFYKKFMSFMESIYSDNFVCNSAVNTNKNLIVLDDNTVWQYSH